MNLNSYRLNYEQMQSIVNNRPLIYVYLTEPKTCITLNHLLFGRTLSFSNPEPAPLITESSSFNLYSSKISNIINHFWDRWRKEYITSLREYQKIVQPKGWDGHTRGVVVGISKSNSLIKRPVNLLYPIEYKKSLNVEQEVFNEQCNQRPARREAAIIGELKRKLTED